MGHREDLLEGAKHCLVERGYSRTTARDIVEASGTNLGSIGYHYGTKDKLLLQAMVEMSGELAEETMALGAEVADAEDRLRAFWKGMIESFRRSPALWKANVEILAQTLHDDELRAQLADTQERARIGLGRAVAPGEAGRAAGSIQFALITGVMTQHLIDPDRAPDADAIVNGLKAIAKMQ
ncbi:TetR/AcrR family transcriptional regulator [Glycomyces harbinensis]|uniref:Transcriptional regulator, TetR family n=1 Tax=Glycomyces harbinensis TaxID=58114 RepID=A0A1G6XHN5_9ACTN|nr:TetR/AcrR family transcriptional regulator [Glycomyces harbinensis]SDD76726.1 transcriptional regulator, TetR family [Glycomyces harbinensis]